MMARRPTRHQPRGGATEREPESAAWLRVGTGGVVILQERRPDGLPGVEWHYPPDEYTDAIGEQFVAEMQAKHAATHAAKHTPRLTLVRGGLI